MTKVCNWKTKLPETSHALVFRRLPNQALNLLAINSMKKHRFLIEPDLELQYHHILVANFLGRSVIAPA